MWQRRMRAVRLGGPARRRGLDPDLTVLRVRTADGDGELLCHGSRDLEPRLAIEDLDPADVLLADPSAPTDDGKQPARVGVHLPADVHAEPRGVAHLATR